MLLEERIKLVNFALNADEKGDDHKMESLTANSLFCDRRLFKI